MAALNVASVEKKLAAVTNSQDNIQSLSLWVIHHKAHHEKIVDLWFKALKKAKITHRLTLFYLCNDIVQTCKRKHAIVYKDAFKEVLKDAVLLVRDSSVKRNVERIFTIWEERNVYDGEFISELQTLHDNSKARAAMNTRLLAEYQPQKVINKLQLFSRQEMEADSKRKQIKMSQLEDSNVEAIRQLKDRSHSNEYAQQFEESCVRLEEYVAYLEKQITEGHALVEMLEQGEIFYDAQFGEAKVVVNAYKTFGTRVSNLKKKLDETMKTLPDTMSPIPSPSMDVPSPGDTPPHIQDATGNVEPADMDLSDEEHAGEKHKHSRSTAAGLLRRDSTTTTKAYPQPIPSITEIHMHSYKKFLLGENHSPLSLDSPPPSPSPIEAGGDKNSEEPFASFFPGLTMAKSSFFKPTDSGSNTGSSTPTLSWNPRQGFTSSPGHTPKKKDTSMEGSPKFDGVGGGGDSTPVKDEPNERSATPVMDEQPEEESAPEPEPVEPPENVANPIEFLTQLITQTKKSNTGSTNFLQTLSALTSTVKTQQYNNKEEISLPSPPRELESEDSPGTGGNTPSSWAAWKAQQQQQQPQPPLPIPQPITLPQPPAILPLGSHDPVPTPTPPPQYPQPLTQMSPTPAPYPTHPMPPAPTPPPPIYGQQPPSPQQPMSHPSYQIPPPSQPHMPAAQGPPYPVPQQPPQPPSPIQPPYQPQNLQTSQSPPTPPQTPYQFRPQFPPPNFQQGPPSLQQPPPNMPRTPGPVPMPSHPPRMPLGTPQPVGTPHQLPSMGPQNIPVPPTPPMQPPVANQQAMPSWGQPLSSPQPPNILLPPSSTPNSESDLRSPQRLSPKGRQIRSNLTTIQTMDFEEDGSNGDNTMGAIPTIGGPHFRPLRPTFPPGGLRGPGFLPTPPQYDTGDDAQEFKAKLKRKSQISPDTPAPPPAVKRCDSYVNSNLRNLTLVPTVSDDDDTEASSSENKLTDMASSDPSVTLSSETGKLDKKALEEASELLEKELAIFQAEKSKQAEKLQSEEGTPIRSLGSSLIETVGNHGDREREGGDHNREHSLRRIDANRPNPTYDNYHHERRDPYYQDSYRRDYYNESYFDRGPRLPFHSRGREHFGRPPKRLPHPMDRRPFYRY